MSKQVITIVTEKLIEKLKAGIKPWERPWKKGVRSESPMFPKNLKTGTQYSGINWLVLMSQGMDKGYMSPYWMTAKQTKEAGGTVRKGEKGTPILWASPITSYQCQSCEHLFKKTVARCPKCKSKDISSDMESRLAWRYYVVFNAEQLEGIEVPAIQQPEDNSINKLEHAESFLKNSGARINHGGDQAFYMPSADYIQLPVPEAFKSIEGYYATALHELGHWTGHTSRMNRDLANRFGTKAYAFEELVAELTSAYTCAVLDIDSNLENHTSYLNGWLSILTEKPGALIEAASKATKAYEYLNELNTQAPTVKESLPVAKPVALSIVPSTPKTTLKEKHGVTSDTRQTILEQLALAYMSADESTENNVLTIHYASCTYNVKHSREAIGRMLKAMGFSKQLKELAA